MFRPGVSPRTPEQEAVRAAARLLVLTRRMRLALERTYLPIERSSLLSAGVTQLRNSVDNDLRGRWPSVSPVVLRILERVDVRLGDFEQFTTISMDSFHLLRLVRAEVLSLTGRSAEALHELERYAVFLSVQSSQLRAEMASRYFDLCTANGRFADGTRVLLYLLSWSHRKWVCLPEMYRQFATILRRRAAVRAMGMVYSATALTLWNWFAVRLRPRRFRNNANRLFFSLVLSQIWSREAAKRGRAAPPRAIRAMGGVGDLLTMTPGIRALSKKSGQKVQFAVPRRFASLFESNDQVKLCSLEEQGVDWLLEGPVLDLTDCPAARGESATVPDVRSGRIELFAAALGIRRKELRRFGQRPFYEPTPDELAAAEVWLRERGLSAGEFIAVQAEPAEAYKRYDRMPEVAQTLSKLHPVVALHDRALLGYDTPNVYCAFGLPLGVGLAIACELRLIVAADSAFVHLSGARDIPCIAIFGPTDGRLATKFYPKAQVLDQRLSFACMPCWRNETIPCLVTGGMRSACLDTLSVEAVVEVAHALIARHPDKASISVQSGRPTLESPASNLTPREQKSWRRLPKPQAPEPAFDVETGGRPGMRHDGLDQS